ncbi:peptidyl-prolyl cis-trans isomerase [Athelia psychrophila]|uniref:peptidylprolyl isomerase n=1 Tax=Athelia psychrophila TaxID=1759441 RepID=A0A165WPA1_9AGAM|nr:peptidyl-prolyl cis-trans isomerase [Fibularhizoctonia sp. CBS 109695]
MGVEIERIKAGDGVHYPKAGDTVLIHYTGTLVATGAQFDSSRGKSPDKPFSTKIGVGKVIKGWDEGVPQLSLGERANLIITPDFGYGAGGYPPIIPPQSGLKFDVELIAINP